MLPRRVMPTVILPTDGLDNLVHAPAVEIGIGDDLEGKVVLLLVSLDGLEWCEHVSVVVAVTI